MAQRRIIKIVKIKDKLATPITEDIKYFPFLGNVTTRLYKLLPCSSTKIGMEYFGPERDPS